MKSGVRKKEKSSKIQDTIFTWLKKTQLKQLQCYIPIHIDPRETLLPKPRWDWILEEEDEDEKES